MLGAVIRDYVAQTLPLLRWCLRLELRQLGLEMFDPPLELGFTKEGGVQVCLVSIRSFTSHGLVPPCFLLALLKLCDAAAEEVVDDFELADTGLEVSAGGSKVAVRLWRFEMGAVEG